MARGLFITFEGSEGCGKSTQVQRLAARLEKADLPFVVTREPGGTPIGETIRHLLKFAPQGNSMTPEAELLLFAASRSQLVRELIQPRLAAGEIVIADRFADSTTVYQGVARRLEANAVASINEFAVGDCWPDITFVLDLEAPLALARLRRRVRPAGAPDRMEQEPLDFYERVRQGYLALAAAAPARVRLIDAAASPDVVEAQIWRELSTALPAA